MTIPLEPDDDTATTVGLWLVTLDVIDDAGERACLRPMSSEEHERYRRFKALGARRQFAVGRALLRTRLSHHAEIAPADWRFTFNPQGKPAIAGPLGSRDLRFNLSHTDGLVALAITEGREIGIDVERIDREVEPLDLAHTAFAPTEIAALEGLADDQRRARFFDIWTLKEAYAKARGLGVSLPFTRFAFDLDGDGIRFTSAEDADRWCFQLSAPTRDHVLAIACPGRDLLVALHHVDPRSLIEDLERL